MTSERSGIYREDLGDPPSPETIESWRNKSHPDSINVDVTDNCNLRCPHCPLPDQLIRRKQRTASGETVTPFNIDADIVLLAYKEIFSWPTGPVIQVTANGEPTLHPRIKEILCIPAEKGLDVVFTNNGTRLSPSLVEALCVAGVKTINISLDAATPDTYAKVRPSARGTNMFPTVVRNIKEAVAVRNRVREGRGTKTEIMINMIRRSETGSELEQFLALKTKLGVDKVVYRPLNSNAGLTGGLEAASNITYSGGVITQIDGFNRWACQFPFRKLNLGVSWSGELRATWCPHGWDRSEFDLGFFPRDGSLFELWNSPKMRSIREAHLNQTIGPDSPCAKCPDWYVVSRDQPALADIVKQ